MWKMQCLVWPKCVLCLENLLLVYKTIMWAIWAYRCEFWEISSYSNIDIIQRLQFKILRSIMGSPWYVSNRTLHNDSSMPYVRDVIERRATNHYTRLGSSPRHSNVPKTTQENQPHTGFHALPFQPHNLITSHCNFYIFSHEDKPVGKLAFSRCIISS